MDNSQRRCPGFLGIGSDFAGTLCLCNLCRDHCGWWRGRRERHQEVFWWLTQRITNRVASHNFRSLGWNLKILQGQFAEFGSTSFAGDCFGPGFNEYGHWRFVWIGPVIASQRWVGSTKGRSHYLPHGHEKPSGGVRAGQKRNKCKYGYMISYIDIRLF